jgi:hypothetical protein
VGDEEDEDDDEESDGRANGDGGGGDADGGDGDGEGGRGDGSRGESDGVERWAVRGKRLYGDNDSGMDGGVEGDGWLYDGGVRMRLESSSPSLSSSTSHLLFLIRLAGGDIGGVVSAGTGALAVAAGAGGGQAVVMTEGHRWRRRRCLQLFVATVCVGNQQNSVTSW